MRGTCLLIILVSCLGMTISEQTPLRPGELIPRDLAGDGVHTYTMSLGEHQFVLGYADQKTVDVVVRILAPGGEPVAQFDDPARGPEYFQFVSEVPGEYRIEITPFQEQEGVYEMYLARAEPLATSKAQKVDQLLARFDRKDAPGVAVAIVENGVDVYGRGWGAANLEYWQPITTSTIFDIASVSKQFGAMAIALLVDQGKLSLDDDVRDHWKDFPDFGETVTIRHLVHHTSGLRDWPGTLAMAGVTMDDVISFDRILRMVEKQQDLNFTPGDEYLYSNTGYNVLAQIVQEVTGQSFRVWTHQNIFAPLGMDDTHFQDNHQEVVERKAYGYGQDNNGFVAINNGLTALASSSLFTTTDDLVEWVNNFDKLIVGNPRVMDMVHTRGVLNSGEEISYAFGQGISTYKGHKRVQHTGSWAGFRTCLARFPDQGVSVVLLSNAANTNPSGLAMQIADVYLPAPKDPPQPEAKTEEEPEVQPVTVPPVLMDRYVGTWAITNGPTVSITREGATLYAKMEGQPRFRLIPTGLRSFKVDIPGAEASVTFDMNGHGKALTGTVYQDGETRIRRKDEWEPRGEDLEEFAGRYFSKELETSYTLSVDFDHLVASHVRNDPIKLSPEGQDRFDGSAWFFTNVTFERDDEGQVVAFRVSNGRVRNVLFQKVNQDH